MGAEFETREEAEASYDLQIKLLRAGDFKGWQKETGVSSILVINTISIAWALSGPYPRSLFSTLPGCRYCASQFERRGNLTLVEEEMKKKILGGSSVRIPFGEEHLHLEEFKGRQLKGRFDGADSCIIKGV
jgi:hypothetical protein